MILSRYLAGWDGYDKYIYSIETDPLRIAKQPNPFVIDCGEDAKLTVKAAGGTAPYIYQWMMNGEEIDGAVGSAFIPSKGGNYRCGGIDKVFGCTGGNLYCICEYADGTEQYFRGTPLDIGCTVTLTGMGTYKSDSADSSDPVAQIFDLDDFSLEDVKDSLPVILKTGMASDEALRAAGDTGEIRVPVSAAQNPGFAAGTADLLWDADALTLKKVIFTKHAPDNGTAAVVSEGNFRIAFGNYLAEKNTGSTGLLFTLVFTANAAAEAGSYALMLGNADVVSAAMKPVAVVCRAGAVVLKEVTTTTTTTTTTTETTTTTTTTESTTTTATTESTTTTTTTESTTTVATTEFTTTTTTTESTTTAATEPEFEPGDDIDGDGTFSVADAVLLQRFVTEDRTLSKAKIAKVLKAAPDRDGDGTVTVLDVALLLRKLNLC